MFIQCMSAIYIGMSDTVSLQTFVLSMIAQHCLCALCTFTHLNHCMMKLREIHKIMCCSYSLPYTKLVSINISRTIFKTFSIFGMCAWLQLTRTSLDGGVFLFFPAPFDLSSSSASIFSCIILILSSIRCSTPKMAELIQNDGQLVLIPFKCCSMKYL